MSVMLRRRILGRLVLVTVALAGVAGAAAYLLERRAIDQRVFALALDESRNLASPAEALAAAGPEDRERVRREVTAHLLAEHIAEGHFVVIELYDPSGRMVVQATHPGFAAVERRVDAEHHVAPREGEQVHGWFTIDGVSYVQVRTPLAVGGRTPLSFEGLFRIAPEAMLKMNRELAWSVLLVVMVVLATVAALYPVMFRLRGDLLRLTDDLAHANMGMLAALGSAVARRDRGTNAHNYRVTIYAIDLARALRLSEDQIRGLIKGAFLHDVGKIGITDAILRKPGRLTAEETATMHDHVRYGVEIVGRFGWLDDALEVVRCHHEQVNGGGYPAGLKGEQIPIAARIFAVVDVFDALTTRRPYKEALPFDEALALLEAGRGTSFDPAVLDAFVPLASELHWTICCADELTLSRTLDRLLVKYFPAPPGGHGRRAPPQLGTLTAGPALTPAPVPARGPARTPADAPLGYLSGSWALPAAPRSVARAQPPDEEAIEGPLVSDDPFLKRP